MAMFALMVVLQTFYLIVLSQTLRLTVAVLWLNLSEVLWQATIIYLHIVELELFIG